MNNTDKALSEKRKPISRVLIFSLLMFMLGAVSGFYLSIQNNNEATLTNNTELNNRSFQSDNQSEVSEKALSNAEKVETESGNGGTQPSKNSSITNSVTSERNTASENFDDLIGVSTGDETISDVKKVYAKPKNTQVLISTGQIKRSLIIDQKVELTQYQNSSIVNENNDDYPFEITFRGIGGLFLYPQRDFVAPGDGNLTNISLGVDYKMSNNSYLGIEIGREVMDLYIESGLGILVEESSLYIYGVHYKYEFNGYKLFDQIIPMSEMMVGGTVSGPIFKTRLGLAWLPEKRIKLFGALEATGLFYRYLGNTEYTAKISANVGISVAF